MKTILLAGIASLTVATSAHAQTTDRSAPDEIIVTAQKRAENIQDVPISIDALGSDSLLKQRITSSDDLAKEFPNLSIQQASSINSGFTIRGVGTNNYHLTAQQAVGQYVDEVSLVTPFTGQLGLYDLERVEVLRGPQNTLFGRNTTGGAVNYITNKPDPDAGIEGYGRLTYGRFNRVDVEGAINVPLADTLAVRGAFQVQLRDGPYRNVLTDEQLGATERYSGRLSVGWEPDADTSVLLSGHVGYSRGTRQPRKAIGRFNADNTAECGALTQQGDQFLQAVDCLTFDKSGTPFNPSLDGWRDTYDGWSNRADVDYVGGLLRIDRALGSVDLTSLTSYDRTEVAFAENLSGLPYLQQGTYQQGDYKIFSQELRLSGSFGEAQWILGGFYSNEKDDLATIARNNSVGPATRAVMPMVTIDQEGNIYSLYGQVDYAVSDTVSITGGLRWTSDRKTGLRNVINQFDTVDGLRTSARLGVEDYITREQLEANASAFTNACAPGVTPCSGPLLTLTQNLSQFAGKIGVDVQLADDVMAYASYSKGFKSGSFDIRAQAVFNGTGDNPVQPESLDAYEIGLKTELFDRLATFNIATFFYKWKDLQTFGTIPDIGPAFINVPGSELLGAEASLQIKPGNGWQISLAGGYTDSKVTDVGNLVSDVAEVGAPLPRTPKWTFNGSLEKSMNIGEFVLTPRVSARYRSLTQGGLTFDPANDIKATVFVDTAIDFEFGNDLQYVLTLFVDNLTGTKTCAAIGLIRGVTDTQTCLLNEGVALYGANFLARF